MQIGAVTSATSAFTAQKLYKTHQLRHASAPQEADASGEPQPVDTAPPVNESQAVSENQPADAPQSVGEPALTEASAIQDELILSPEGQSVLSANLTPAEL